MPPRQTEALDIVEDTVLEGYKSEELYAGAILDVSGSMGYQACIHGYGSKDQTNME